MIQNIKPEYRRLISSRKIWGGCFFSMSVFVVILIADITVAPIAIGALATVWLAVISGQAVGDYIKNQNDNLDGGDS